MYCNECGHENREGAKFCDACGARLNTVETPKLIKLKCNDCGGVMETDADQTVAKCKFCGSTAIFAVSEEVRLKRMDVELGEIGVEQTKADIEKIKEERWDMVLPTATAFVAMIIIAIFFYIIVSI